MSDIIRLLPESIANQIAAGEVVPGPSYVVKELLENAIDAGATSIKLEVSDGGKATIHIIDNGKGMTPSDARMAFEKHATSKISTSEDLYCLTTMGFRGEALAAIAAVSRVELCTRPENEELGTKIEIAGSEVSNVEVIATPKGTSIMVRDIFFNTPARRRFLKSNTTEYRSIQKEFERVALVNPEVAMSLYKDGVLDIDLPSSSLKKRILQLEGAKLEKDLLPIQYESEMIRISGYIGKPSGARAKGVRQFLFANNRYIEHRFFRSAIIQPYDQLIPAKSSPNFFVYFTLPPKNIDVNINPTKTEVRFVDEAIIWPILQSLVREALSAYATVPLIEFIEKETNIPTYTGRKELSDTGATQISNAEPYRRRVFMGMHSPIPLKEDQGSSLSSKQVLNSYNLDWDSMGDNFQMSTTHASDVISEAQSLFGIREMERSKMPTSSQTSEHTIYKHKYIVTPLRGGLALVHFTRARFRIEFDRILNEIKGHHLESQELLYSDTSTLTMEEATLARNLSATLNALGFEYEVGEDNLLRLIAAPKVIIADAVEVLLSIIAEHLDLEDDSIEDTVAKHLAMLMAEIQIRKLKLRPEGIDISNFLASLFASSDPNLTPRGKKIIVTLSELDLDRLFTSL